MFPTHIPSQQAFNCGSNNKQPFVSRGMERNSTLTESLSPFKKMTSLDAPNHFGQQHQNYALSFEEATDIAKKTPMSYVTSNGDGSFKLVLRDGSECAANIKVESTDRHDKSVYVVNGNWVEGIAYDLHTLTSKKLGPGKNGHGVYDTKRTEMGELVYKLKYQQDITVVKNIVDLIQKVVDFSKVDAIVTIPPSNVHRAHQPVEAIASEVGKRFETVVYYDALEKTSCSQQLKEIKDRDKRMEVLKKTMQVTGKRDLTGKTILLLDDLYRSGSTLNVATQLLLENAKVENVYVLTMTKTRSNR